jgi:hypothetical protein
VRNQKNRRMKLISLIIFGLLLGLNSSAQLDAYDVVNNYLTSQSAAGLEINLYYRTINELFLDKFDSLTINRVDFKTKFKFILDAERDNALIDTIFNQLDKDFVISQIKKSSSHSWIPDSLDTSVKLFKKYKKVRGALNIHCLSYPIFTNTKKEYAFLYDSFTESDGWIFILGYENTKWTERFSYIAWQF